MKDLSIVCVVYIQYLRVILVSEVVDISHAWGQSRGSLITSSVTYNLELGIRGSLATSQDTTISFGVSIK